MKKTLIFATTALFFAILSSCSKTCYDNNNQPYDCTTGISGGGGNTNYGIWTGPFIGTQTVQFRVKDTQLKTKKDYPRNYSVLADQDRNGYVDMQFGGPAHDYVWVQGLITYNGITYWAKCITKNLAPLSNSDLITVTVSTEQTKPFAVNVNSYNDFGGSYYDQTGQIPLVMNNSAASQLYNSEGIYAMY